MNQPSQKIVLGIYAGEDATKIAVIDSDRHVLAQGEDLQQLPDLIRDVGQLDAVETVYDQKQPTSIAELFPDIPHFATHKAVAVLVTGAGREYGVATLCDDEMVMLGVGDKLGRRWAGERGKYLDAGGCFAVGREVLQTVCDGFDGLDGSNELTDRVLDRLKLRSQSELLEWLRGCQPDAIAPLAEEAIALERSDTVATGIISRTADRLAAQVQAVALQLEMKRFPLVMAGGMFNRSELLHALFVQAVQTLLPGAVPMLVTQDYAVCAGVMALSRLGVALPQLDLSDKTTLRRATEQRNPLTVDIQNRPTSDFVRLMNAEDQRVPRLIAPQLGDIVGLINMAAERYEKGGRLFFVGAGTSGRLAVLDAAECRPTFGTTPDEVAGILAGGEEAMIHSIEGAEDDEAQGRAEIAARNVGRFDTVIGIAASGSTPFVIGAVNEAGERGALTGCISNNAESLLARRVQRPIVIPTGPEVIMGSTRLKAGTAQKLVLNMISTGVMMRVGKTYGNLMTNMQMSNIKLRKRAAVIVAEATELPIEEATDLLERCNHEMKTAIASHLLHLSPEKARARLETFKGNLYRCIHADKTSS